MFMGALEARDRVWGRLTRASAAAVLRASAAEAQSVGNCFESQAIRGSPGPRILAGGCWAWSRGTITQPRTTPQIRAGGNRLI
jgi:hypothetical protein